ncbi:hypothetical protein [Roseimicrobium sp. ORNL1]|uniref:hypothetical protein n=1 Tax=Roseimicrobium sp. ORNL1 TaxID=2711231 RepID=UPI0013E1189F|nr:hypothetical protein [Roseimicrobium sp. ORNL1]QIF02045.1 hypothetical protein G5S37_11045 [Roseimicrobium sp. ORNL1]
MTFLQAFHSKSLRTWWPWILSTFPVLVIFSSLAVAPVGHMMFLWFKLPYFLAVFPALLMVVILPLRALLWREERSLMLAWWCATLVFLASLVAGEFFGQLVRHRAFNRLAERSAPLVEAIKKYEKEHGAPPPSLESLVPQYLPTVPRTGIMAYPTYRYYPKAKDSKDYEGNPWILSVSTPSGGINFDEFLYFPLQNYPETGYGGGLQRIRDWAYLHE